MPFGKATLAAGAIVLAVSAAYSNSLFGPLIFDDPYVVRENPSIRSLWAIGSVLSPPAHGWSVQGRPVINLSLAVNYALGGEAVPGYHLLNLAVHVLAAVVLFGVVRRTLLLPGRPERSAGQSAGLALAIALLWGVHPLATAAVTYITQRTESLMALCYLLTLYCVIRSAPGGHKGLWQTAAVLACLLGMGCKEVMVSAPLVVLLYDRVFLSRSFKECFRQRGLLYAGLAASWVLLAHLVIGSGTRGGTAGFCGKAAWWQYALTQCQAIATYLKLCFWPHPLVLDYGTHLITDPVKVWPQALLLAVLLAGVLAAVGRQPWIGFLGLCFFAVLAPTSSIVPVVTQTMAEHRMYLPLAMVIALTVLLLYHGWERIRAVGRLESRQWRWAPAVALVVTATLLGGLTLRRNADYRSEWAIWNDTINKRPGNARAYKNRGDVYLDNGQLQEAIADYNQAIVLKPDFFEAYNNRGNSYKDLGRFREAIADYNQAITLKPDHFAAYNNRGNSHKGLGQFQEAFADYAQAIALKPDYADAYFNRGGLYQRLGQFPQAIADFSRALALKPDDAEAFFNRALGFQNLGQSQQALQDCTQAISLKRNYAEAYNARGNAYQTLDQLEQAIQDYAQAIALKPDFALAFYNRAIAFYNLKQFDRAWADVAQAKQLGCAPKAEFLRALSEASGHSGN